MWWPGDVTSQRFQFARKDFLQNIHRYLSCGAAPAESNTFARPALVKQVKKLLNHWWHTCLSLWWSRLLKKWGLMIPAHESAHQTVTCSLWRGHDVDGKFAGCLHSNHALRVLGPWILAMGENAGDDAVEEQLHVCETSGAETDTLNSLLHGCVQALWGILPRFFTTEPVPLKFSTHNTMDLWSGTDTRGGIWNWEWNACRAITTDSSLRIIASTAKALCAFDHAIPPATDRLGCGQNGIKYKTYPSTLSSTGTIIATALNFTHFSLHNYEIRKLFCHTL